MGKVVAAADHSIDVLVRIGNKQLEGAEQFLAANFKVFDELVKRYLNCCWLVCAVNFGNVVIFERVSSEAELGAWNRQDFIGVGFDSGIIPCQNGPDCQILEFSSCSQCSNLIDEASFHPIFVNEHNRLSRALLPRGSVCILI